MANYIEKTKTSISWFGDIPKDWKIERVKTHFDFSKDSTNPEGKHILSLTMKGIKIRDVSNNDGQLPESFDGYRYLKIGDIVFNPMDLISGYVDLANIEGIISPAYTVLRKKDNSKVNLKYITLQFQRNYKEKIFWWYGQGVSFDHRWELKDKTLMNFPILIPTELDQENIVNEVKKVDRFINRFTTSKNRYIELLKQYKQSKINELVTKGLNPNVKMKDSGTKWLGKVPEHWRILKLKKLVKLNSSTSKNLNNKVALENIESWTGRFIQGEGNPFEADGVQFENGDVLFCKLRPYLAKVFLPTEDGVCVNELLVLKPNTNLVSKEFIYTRLLTYDFIQLVNSSTYGAKMPRASWDFIGEIEIPFPTDFEEQNAIFNMTNQINTGINQLIDKALNQIELIQQYRQSLIYELVTGKRKP